jgi:hypothetical protein
MTGAAARPGLAQNRATAPPRPLCHCRRDESGDALAETLPPGGLEPFRQDQPNVVSQPTTKAPTSASIS